MTSQTRTPLPGAKGKTNARINGGKKNNGSRRKTHMFGLPIKEAEGDFRIPLLQVDVDNAEKERPDDVNDEENFLSCVIAQAVTRAAGAERVAILRRYAYVAFPGDKRTRRYMISERARNTLERWDRGEEVDTDVELVLRAPKKTETRAAMRKAIKNFLARHPDYYKDRSKDRSIRKTDRKQSPSDQRDKVVRHGNLVRFS